MNLCDIISKIDIFRYYPHGLTIKWKHENLRFLPLLIAKPLLVDIEETRTSIIRRLLQAACSRLSLNLLESVFSQKKWISLNKLAFFFASWQVATWQDILARRGILHVLPVC